MPLISIVVPVYNAEKYLPQCIESLQSQTLTDIEIILVNDGSTDDSLKICDSYAESDDRITILSKANEGVAKARRDGIMKARSEFIAFIDSDDYYEPSFCEVMLACIRKAGADLVECDYYSVSTNARREHRIHAADLELDCTGFRETVVRNTIVNGSEAVVLWNKLYRRQIIMKTVKEFGDNQLEDYVFNAQYYTMVEHYAYIHQCLTNYRQVPMSLSRKCNLQAYEILQRAETIKEGCLDKMGLVTEADQAEDALWYVNYSMNYLRQYLLADVPHSDSFIEEILSDEMLRQKCSRITKENRFAGLIVNGSIGMTMRQLKNQARMDKTRIYLSRIKRMMLPR